MKNLGIILAALMAVTPVLAWTSFDINTQTGALLNDFSGSFASGTVNYDIGSNWFGTNIVASSDWKNGNVQTVTTKPGILVGTDVSASGKGSIDNTINSNWFSLSESVASEVKGDYNVHGTVTTSYPVSSFNYIVTGDEKAQTEFTTSIFLWQNPTTSLWIKTW